MACPAGAINEAPEDFEHKACYETLKEFRRKGYTSQFICGICVRDCRGPETLSAGKADRAAAQEDDMKRPNGMTRREFFAAGAGLAGVAALTSERRAGSPLPGIRRASHAGAAQVARRPGQDGFPGRRRQEVSRPARHRPLQGQERADQAELQHLRSHSRLDPQRHPDRAPRPHPRRGREEPGHRRPERTGGHRAGLRQERGPGHRRVLRRQAPELRRARRQRLHQVRSRGLALEGRLPRRPARGQRGVRRLDLLSEDAPVRRRLQHVAQELRRHRAAQGARLHAPAPRLPRPEADDRRDQRRLPAGPGRPRRARGLRRRGADDRAAQGRRRLPGRHGPGGRRRRGGGHPQGPGLERRHHEAGRLRAGADRLGRPARARGRVPGRYRHRHAGQGQRGLRGEDPQDPERYLTSLISTRRNSSGWLSAWRAM
ncbi:MAG: hypothetical protein MZV70_70385 [Desulfobacterales bacterium]|nr:hypothetical protein [Desulfobacterales bacterium]